MRTPRRSRMVLTAGAALAGGLLLLAWLAGLTAPAKAKVLAQGNPNYDYTITKIANPPQFTIGENNTYIINVSGFMTLAGEVPVVFDLMPADLTIVPGSVVATDWNCLTPPDMRSISCNYSSAGMPSEGFPRSFTFPAISFRVDVDPDVVSPVLNTAQLLNDDDNLGNNEAPVTTDINSVDLEIEKSVTPILVDEGGMITYTLVITNNGPVQATNVRVLDPLSTYLTNPVPSIGFPYDRTTGWTLGNLSDDQTVTLTLSAQTITGSDGRLIENTAEVTSDNLSDWDLTNNEDTASFFVGGIDIVKSVSDNSVFVGEEFVYTINVVNTGGVNATFVTISDTIPSDLQVLRTSHGSVSNNVLTYRFSPLRPNTPLNITVRVRARTDVTSVTQVTNRASVAWGGTFYTNPVLINRSNEVTVDLTPAAWPDISKSDGLTNVSPNQTITYTVMLTNTGSLAVSQVRLEDTLSGNLTYIGIVENGVDIDQIGSPSAQTHIYQVNGLDPAERVTFYIKARVSASATSGQIIRNDIIASLTLPGNGTASDSFFDQSTVVIPSAPNLRFTKDVTPSQAMVGEFLVFKLRIENTGNTSINNIRVTDVFPDELDFSGGVQVDVGTATLNSSTRTINWTISSLTAGEDANLSILTKINTSAVPRETYTNQASLTADPNQATESNIERFRVLPGSTLPGTGGGQFEGGQMDITRLAQIIAWLALLLGAGVVFYSLWARSHRPLWAARYVKIGLGLIGVSLFLFISSWGIGQVVQPTSPPLAVIGGVKPLIATEQAPVITKEAREPVVQAVDIAAYLPTPTPSSLPDYPIPTPSVIPTNAPGSGEPDASAIQRIRIPRLALDTVVKFVPYEGGTWLIGGLKQEVAWMGDTSWPGLGGNTGLAGHVDLADGSDGPFWRLSELKAGDEVLLHTERNVYTYQVREQVVVPDYDMSVIEATEKAQITLITCTGWDTELRTYLQRLIVFADLVSVAPLQTQGN